jgi:hypothetical protein
MRCTLEIGPLGHAHARPATEGRACSRHAGRDCHDILGQVRDRQAELLQHEVQPSKTDSGLEGVLARLSLGLDAREQRRNDLREPVGGR